MATQVKQTPVDETATRTSTSISGPAYKVTVGGTARGKPRRYKVSTTSQKTIIEEYRVRPRYLKPSTGSCHDSCKHAEDEWMESKNTRRLGTNRRYSMTTSRYLSPSNGSCHDSCKHGKDESMELKTTRTLASRKRAVTKSNGVKRTVVSVERKKITQTKPKPPRDPKIHAPGYELKMQNRAKTKPMTVIRPSSSTLKNKKVTKVTGTAPSKPLNNRKPKLVSPRKDQHVITKAKLRQLIAEKIQEMTLQEAETEEVGVEETIDQSPENLTTESTIILNDSLSESSHDQSCSNEQVSESESEHADDEVCHEELLEEEFEYDEDGYILEEEDDDDDDDDDDDKKTRRYRVVRSEDKDGPRRVIFRRGGVLEVDGEDGPRRIKFTAGTVLDSDEEGDSEKVNLKHQEVGKKEAKELLNSVIEETASKLVGDMKTKVEALVGAFETVISRQDEVPSSE